MAAELLTKKKKQHAENENTNNNISSGNETKKSTKEMCAHKYSSVVDEQAANASTCNRD